MPPDLDDLVERWGGYDKIPEAEWRRFERGQEATKLWLRIHHKPVGSTT
jgi:hypothetical protein